MQPLIFLLPSLLRKILTGLPPDMQMNRIFYFGVLITMFIGMPALSWAQSSITVSGRIQSVQGERIPFASIIDLNSVTEGTTSDEVGQFTLSLGMADTLHRIQFSSVGYKDTIISVADLSAEHLVVQLSSQAYYLEEVIISSSDKLTDSYFGLPNGSILQFGDGDTGFPNSAGRASGVYVSPGKKDKGVINSVEIYITKEGFYSAPLLMRILVPEMEMKENKLESGKKFRDLLHEPIVVRAEKPGWVAIDLSSHAIRIPKRNFIVMFTPLDYGEKYLWTSKFGKRYGAVIGTYDSKMVPHMKWAMQINGKYCYDNSTKRDFVPAVVIHYSQQSE